MNNKNHTLPSGLLALTILSTPCMQADADVINEDGTRRDRWTMQDFDWALYLRAPGERPAAGLEPGMHVLPGSVDEVSRDSIFNRYRGFQDEFAKPAW